MSMNAAATRTISHQRCVCTHLLQYAASLHLLHFLNFGVGLGPSRPAPAMQLHAGFQQDIPSPRIDPPSVRFMTLIGDVAMVRVRVWSEDLMATILSCINVGYWPLPVLNLRESLSASCPQVLSVFSW